MKRFTASVPLRLTSSSQTCISGLSLSLSANYERFVNANKETREHKETHKSERVVNGDVRFNIRPFVFSNPGNSPSNRSHSGLCDAPTAVTPACGAASLGAGGAGGVGLSDGCKARSEIHRRGGGQGEGIQS